MRVGLFSFRSPELSFTRLDHNSLDRSAPETFLHFPVGGRCPSLSPDRPTVRHPKIFLIFLSGEHDIDRHAYFRNGTRRSLICGKKISISRPTAMLNRQNTDAYALNYLSFNTRQSTGYSRPALKHIRTLAHAPPRFKPDSAPSAPGVQTIFPSSQCGVCGFHARYRGA